MIPIQPYFLNATSRYEKHIVNRLGISHFYTFRSSNSGATSFGVPDDCLDLMICCDPENPGITVCGTGLSPRQLKIRNHCEYFGVRFLPGFDPWFLPISFSESIEKDIPLPEQVLPHHCFDLILTRRDFHSRKLLFMDMYQRGLSVSLEDTAHKTRDLIWKTHGRLSIQKIADLLGYSRPYITRVFRHAFGMSPKMFSEILRFQNSLDAIKTSANPNYMDIAIDSGYFDESHMLSTYRKFTRRTPGECHDYFQTPGYKTALKVV